MSDETNQTDSSQTDKEVITEEVKVSGEAVVGKVKEIIREGTARRIAIKNEEGKTVLEIPLIAGAAVIFPPVATLAAIGAVGALIANLSITIERESKEIVARSDEGDKS